MRTPDFDVHELIEALKGTCDSMEQHLPDGMVEDDLTFEDLATLDGEIFLCTQCGWWCESSECNDTDNGVDQLCNDCHEEQEND